MRLFHASCRSDSILVNAVYGLVVSFHERFYQSGSQDSSMFNVIHFLIKKKLSAVDTFSWHAVEMVLKISLATLGKLNQGII